MSSITQQFADLLSTVQNPGAFYTTGIRVIPLPRLEVEGVGTIALPLQAAQAEQLIAVAERAPFGRGEETLVDIDVRRTWQIAAEQLRIEGQNWERTLQDIVADVAVGLGVSGTVVPDLYKLLVYDEGSFFVSHRDTEKRPGMFATLLVALPSMHEGGELLVRHKGQEVRLDLRCQDPSEAAFAAFYADCVHEVLPVTSGHRLVLVYNLLRPGHDRRPQPPNYDTEQAAMAALLKRWSAAKQSAVDGAPDKLIYPLEHAYSPAEISFLGLKGADAAVGTVLTVAAQQANCELYVALLSIEESGSAECTPDTDYYSGRGRGRRASEDDFEVGEIFDRSATLSHWVRPDGSPIVLGEVPFENAEISPPNALEDMEPDEQYFHEATGNEGASFEQSYQRAAFVLWPQQQRLAVITQAGLPTALPYLREVTERWVKAGKARSSPLWLEAHELCGRMLHSWPKPVRYGVASTPSDAAQLLTLMTQLEDTEHIATMLNDIIAAGSYGQSDNEALLPALCLFPAQQAGSCLARIVANHGPRESEACADLLARCSQSHHLVGQLLAAGKALVEALPGDPTRVSEPSPAWLRKDLTPTFIIDLVSATARLDTHLALDAVAYLLAWPKNYGIDRLILPATLRLHAQTETRTLEAVARLRDACLMHLRARVALDLQAPSDWARVAASGCSCPYCAELNLFLRHPSQSSWALKASEANRSHVQEVIRRHACDVDSVTDKRGRPYSLVCTKNQASYDKRVAQRTKDLAALGQLA